MPRSEGKVIILTARYGEGHWQVAQALKQQLERYGAEVLIVDLMAEAYPKWDAFIRFLFLHSSTMSLYGFNYYGWSYYGTRRMERNHPLVKTGFALGTRKLKQLLALHRPSGVISTFPFFDVAAVVRRMGMHIPTSTVMTDYDLHHRWIQSTQDEYYVATESLAQLMQAGGIDPRLIHVSGIPVRTGFTEAARLLELGTHAGEGKDLRQASLRQTYGLDASKRTTLIMSGGFGAQVISKRFVERLTAIPDHQCAIVCGRNGRWQALLKKKHAESPNVHIYGYVERVHELMACSDAVVTKAGGLTLTEALVLRVPLFLVRPQPGQERENARYFAKQGAAIVARHESELAVQLMEAYSSPERLSAMRARMSDMARPRAAELIADDVMHRMAAERVRALQ
ncbi:MGDG synthase family glycosyltransferase [Paenibacillus apiarius]|uniref:MGDG synthase family glycosyltransferase n=1 Tax=Paenibacillus apiarius TaxID=46240 RepID=UPI003B3B843E